MQRIFRGAAPLSAVSEAAKRMLLLRRALQEAPDGQGGRLADDANCRRKAAALEVRLAGLQALQARCAAERSAGRDPGAKARMLEVRSAELCLAIAELLVEAAGYYALASADSILLHNEGPVGPPYASPAVQGMLAAQAEFGPDSAFDAARRRLAVELLD